ncbi:MAG: hypothetical protein R6U85_00665 [Salinivirgaceae bacterium]
MEILQHSLKKADIQALTSFQKNVWDILSSLFKSLLVDKLSNSSTIEKGLGIDVFLRLKTSDFVLYISFTEDRLYINSKYFDLYIYPETQLEKVELILRQLLQGKYIVKLGYGSKEKLVLKELIFDNNELEEFNEKNKIGFFTRKIKNEKRVDGVKLISG